MEVHFLLAVKLMYSNFSHGEFFFAICNMSEEIVDIPNSFNLLPLVFAFPALQLAC